MPILGAHMSISGGHEKAVERAAERGCDCVQVFTKNNNQWRAKPISQEQADAFAAALDRLAIEHPIAHDSYLINLASPEASLWKKSIDAMIEELQRAERLGIPFVVAHPGAYTTSSEEAGLQRIADALDEVHRQTTDLSTRCLLETTAGQGSNLGWQFEQLAAMLDAVADPDRLGICFDTCHVFAAGYPLGTEEEYRRTMGQFDQTVGVKQIQAFHVNDSKTDFGSRVDRHEHIGHGKIGFEAFGWLMRDRRFREVPMYLETPKGDRDGTPWDEINLAALRKLAKE